MPYDEFYDVAALGYLRGIVNYDRDERLKKYSLTTIVWGSIRSNISNKKRSDKVYRDTFLYSLNDRTEEGTEIGELIEDRQNSFFRAEQRKLQELLELLKKVFTERQFTILTMKLEGYKEQEIMKIEHI